MVVGYNGSANYDIWYVLHSNHTMSTSLNSSHFYTRSTAVVFKFPSLYFFSLSQNISSLRCSAANFPNWQFTLPGNHLPLCQLPWESSHNSLWLHNHVTLVVRSSYDCPYHNRILTWEISWRLFCHVFIRITQNCSIDPLPSGICQETHITVM